MTIELDEDPYLIQSWEEYCKLCIKHKRLDLFKNNLSKLIDETNARERAVLQKYVNNLYGEILREKMDQAIMARKKAKKDRNLQRYGQNSIIRPQYGQI